MAIHFNYIKGLNGNVTKLSENTTTSDSDDLYTFIKWAGRDKNTTPNKDAKYLPHIYVERTNALGSNDLGRIITSHAVNQSFDEEVKHNKSIQLYTNTTNNWSSIRFFCNPSISGVTGATGSLGKIFAKETNENITHWDANKQVNNAGLCVDMGGLFVKNSFYINQTIDNKARVVSYRPLRIDDKSDNVNYVEISEGNIVAGGHIDSLYFNATSDKRAKENIQPATYNAIELIKKLPIYTYNYKNKTETVTGILAQDLLEAQPEGLDLVSNINATGENGDYMSIKNDKLVFILMKAIQEQQEQIEKLQEELNKLKESQ